MTPLRPAPLPTAARTTALAAQALRAWTTRQTLTAVVAGTGVALLVGVATVLVPNPVFAREIPPVWWNYPVWLLTSALSGMLVATYVQPRTTSRSGDGGDGRDGPDGGDRRDVDDPTARRSSRWGVIGTTLAWFAVGCPVCNKLALLALGYSGAITWFTPLQPVLALGALALTGAALLARLRGQVACPVRPQEAVVR